MGYPSFGQSKYFSDNLVENVKRGIRQKIRRGEWLTLAPFGYVNNLKTKNIEPDKVKSRIIKRAFEEYATGTYTLKSLADFLADHGVVQKKGCRPKMIMSPPTKVEMSPLWYTVRLIINHTGYGTYHYVSERS